MSHDYPKDPPPIGERPARFTARFVGSTGPTQCMWEFHIPHPSGARGLHRTYFCTKRRGHDGDHEYSIPGAGKA